MDSGVCRAGSLDRWTQFVFPTLSRPKEFGNESSVEHQKCGARRGQPAQAAVLTPLRSGRAPSINCFV